MSHHSLVPPWVAAGYIVYGSSPIYGIRHPQGVHGFTLNTDGCILSYSSGYSANNNNPALNFQYRGAIHRSKQTINRIVPHKYLVIVIVNLYLPWFFIGYWI